MSKKLLATPPLLAVLVGLYVVSRLVPIYQVSWIIHFLFVFTLTITVYVIFLDSRHLGLYLIGLALSMAAWEAYEWLYWPRIEGSNFITGVDTFFDICFGAMGAFAAIMLARARQKSTPPSGGG